MATYKIFIADLSQHKTKKRHNSLLYNLLCRYELRRQENIIFNTRLDIIYFGRCLLMREPNQDVFLLQYWPF